MLATVIFISLSGFFAIYLLGFAKMLPGKKRYYYIFLCIFFIGGLSLDYYLSHSGNVYYYTIVREEIDKGQNTSTERLNSLMKRGKVPITDRLLELAMEAGNLELTKHLINNDLDYSEADRQGWPTYCKVFYNRNYANIAMIDYFAEKKVNYKYINFLDENLIHYTLNNLISSQNVNPEVFKIYLSKFIEMGLDINHPNRHGETPLFFAINRISSKEVIQILLDNGANKNHLRNDGTSALGLAIEVSDADKIDVLRKYGAIAQYKNEVITEESMKLKLAEARRKEREREASSIIQYWLDYNRVWKVSFDCDFYFMGGKGMRRINSYDNEGGLSTHLFNQVDAYIFSGCEETKNYHYRIYNKNSELFSEEINLSIDHRKMLIKNKNGNYASLWFEESFKGRIEWYVSDGQIDEWEKETDKLEKIKEAKIYVQGSFL